MKATMSLGTAIIASDNVLSLYLLAIVTVQLSHYFLGVGGVRSHAVTDLVVVGECLHEFLVQHGVIKVVVDQSLLPFIISEKGLVATDVPGDLLFLFVNAARLVLAGFLARSITLSSIRRRRLGVCEEFLKDQVAPLVDERARGARTLVQALGPRRAQLVRFQLLQCVQTTHYICLLITNKINNI